MAFPFGRIVPTVTCPGGKRNVATEARAPDGTIRN
jgi:hypothetical protein